MLQGEANGMLNLAGGYFVIANQAGKNREAGGVGGCPCPRTLLIGLKIPDGGGGGVPAAVAVRRSAVEFVEKAIALVHHQHMPIAAAGVGEAFNLSSRGN